MQNTSDLLSHIAAAGVTLALELRVTPASGLTPELRQMIQQHKAVLLRYLAHVAPDGGSARVISVNPEEPGKAGCVVWEVTSKPADQPTLPLNEEKRGSEKPVKTPPTSLEGKKDIGRFKHNVRR